MPHFPLMSGYRSNSFPGGGGHVYYSSSSGGSGFGGGSAFGGGGMSSYGRSSSWGSPRVSDISADTLFSELGGMTGGFGAQNSGGSVRRFGTPENGGYVYEYSSSSGSAPRVRTFAFNDNSDFGAGGGWQVYKLADHEQMSDDLFGKLSRRNYFSTGKSENCFRQQPATPISKYINPSQYAPSRTEDSGSDSDTDEEPKKGQGPVSTPKKRNSQNTPPSVVNYNNHYNINGQNVHYLNAGHNANGSGKQDNGDVQASNSGNMGAQYAPSGN